MNTEGQSEPDSGLEKQKRYADQVRTEAAGNELESRLKGSNGMVVPRGSTEQERRERAYVEHQISQLKLQLEQLERATDGLDPLLIHPDTLTHIAELRGRLQGLEVQVQPEIAPADLQDAPPEPHELTENYELGKDKLNELYGAEREVAERYGNWLGTHDNRARQGDRPRGELRRALISNHLLPIFLLGCEQRGLQRLKTRSGIQPGEAIYENVANTISSVAHQFTRTDYYYGDYLTLPEHYAGDQGGDVLLFRLLCDNSNPGIHVQPLGSGAPNHVRYYHESRQKSQRYGEPDRLVKSEFPLGGSLDSLFERYPELAREIALIQAAEQEIGEAPSLFAESIVPHYEIIATDRDRLDVIIGEFRAINEKRNVLIAEQQSRVSELERGMALELSLKGQDAAYEKVRQELEQSRTTQTGAETELARVQLLIDSAEVPGLLNFTGRRRFNQLQADFTSARQHQAASQRNVAGLEATQGDYARQYREAYDILVKYNLSRSNDTETMNRRLADERRELESLESFVARK